LKYTIAPGSQVIVLELERAEVVPVEETADEEAGSEDEAVEDSATSDVDTAAKPEASAETPVVEATESSAPGSDESVNATTGEGTNP
jgi:hypothetical protein